MPAERALVEEYVAAGKLMQVATVGRDGGPAVCSVWYEAAFRPDKLTFLSQRDRHHSENIRNHGRVAGAIVDIELQGAGQQVRGVSFKGHAIEITVGEHTLGAEALGRYLRRWPIMELAVESGALDPGETQACFYQIDVYEWVLFDQVNYPDDPRRTVPGEY